MGTPVETSDQSAETQHADNILTMDLKQVLHITPRTLNALNKTDDESLVDIEQSKAIFDLFDKDGDGSIPTQELGTAMRALGCFPKEMDIVEMADMVEEINFDQFIQFLKRQKESGYENKESIVDSFLSTCPIVEGKIKFSDLETILKSKTGEELNQDDIQMIQKSISHKMMDNTVVVDDFLSLLLNDLGFGEERDGELENNSQDFQ